MSGRDHLAAALLESLDDAALDELARLLAPRIQAELARNAGENGQKQYAWLGPAAAAQYMGCSTKRVYDLTSSRALEPDGYDGRSPRFSRGTLDAYLRNGARRH